MHMKDTHTPHVDYNSFQDQQGRCRHPSRCTMSLDLGRLRRELGVFALSPEVL